MTDVLSNRPFPLELGMCMTIVQAEEQRIKPGDYAAKPFDEVGEHPWRMNERKLSLRPWRTVEL